MTSYSDEELAWWFRLVKEHEGHFEKLLDDDPNHHEFSNTGPRVKSLKWENRKLWEKIRELENQIEKLVQQHEQDYHPEPGV